MQAGQEMYPDRPASKVHHDGASDHRSVRVIIFGLMFRDSGNVFRVLCRLQLEIRCGNLIHGVADVFDREVHFSEFRPLEGFLDLGLHGAPGHGFMQFPVHISLRKSVFVVQFTVMDQVLRHDGFSLFNQLRTFLRRGVFELPPEFSGFFLKRFYASASCIGSENLLSVFGDCPELPVLGKAASFTFGETARLANP